VIEQNIFEKIYKTMKLTMMMMMMKKL